MSVSLMAVQNIQRFKRSPIFMFHTLSTAMHPGPGKPSYLYFPSVHINNIEKLNDDYNLPSWTRPAV